MGLLNRLTGRAPEAKLPNAWDIERLCRRGLPYYIAGDTIARGNAALRQLKDIPNAGPDDRRALVASALAVIQLAADLSNVEQALNDGSADELYGSLDDSSYVMNGRPRSITHEKTEFDFPAGAAELANSQLKIAEWIEQNVFDQQQEEMLILVERRGLLRDALIEAHHGFCGTAVEIARAERKLRIINAATSFDAAAGQDVSVEHRLDEVKLARGLAGAVSAGLDEAYQAAIGSRPELAELEDKPAVSPAASLAISHDLT